MQVAVVSTFIFRLADGDEAVTPAGHGQAGQNSKSGVAWVLRFGGLMALVRVIWCMRLMLGWSFDLPQSTANEDGKSYEATIGRDEGGK